jgi:hypothetical protein
MYCLEFFSRDWQFLRDFQPLLDKVEQDKVWSVGFHFRTSLGLCEMCCSGILLWRELLPIANSSHASYDDLKWSALLRRCRSIPMGEFLCSVVGIEETKRESRSMRTTSSMRRA